MIAYKYKLYKTPQTKHLDTMLAEACFVWNHALELQKRYYRMFGKYIGVNRIQRHFTKRIPRYLIHSETRQEILQRLDNAYVRFFKHISKRPPKFKNPKYFTSIVFKRMGGYSLNENIFTINAIGKRFKFSLSRQYDGKIKRLTLKRSRVGEYFIIVIIDKVNSFIEKTHNGASVGIDFGLKTYLTLSDGTTVNNPQFLKNGLKELKRKASSYGKSKKGSKNKERKRIEIARIYEKLSNQRNDFQWKLAHDLCRKYDRIFIEDLDISEMGKRWGRKIHDLAHADFIIKLECVAARYGTIVHKIDRYFPSTKTCTCGFINNELNLFDRQWECPVCGTIHDRDMLAANNILRRGIYELGSVYKTHKPNKANARTRSHPTILHKTTQEYAKKTKEFK